MRAAAPAPVLGRVVSVVIAVVIAPVIAALLLAGCGGSAGPKSSPTPSATPSPTPSATPSPPVMPEAATKKTKAGAEATVRHFLRAMDFAGQTGNTSTFKASYARQCTRCRAIASGIRTTYDKGGSIVGGAWRPTQIKFYSITDGVASLDAVVDYEAQSWVPEAGKEPTKSPAQTGVLKTFQLIWSGEKWQVGALDPEA